MDVISPNSQAGCDWCMASCWCNCWMPLFLLSLNSDIQMVTLQVVSPPQA